MFDANIFFKLESKIADTMKPKSIATLLKTIATAGGEIPNGGFYSVHGGLSLTNKNLRLELNLPNTVCTNTQNCTNSPTVCGNPANCALC